GVATTPDGRIKVSIPLSKEQQGMKEVQLVYINEKGECVILPSEVKDGYLVFYTTHFSLYGVTCKTANDPNAPDNPGTGGAEHRTPGTGDSKNLFGYVSVLLIAGMALLLMVRLKKKARFME
ncbi:MAG: hypothetical protein RR954_09110, partial [Christensenellaceae bacterium]